MSDEQIIIYNCRFPQKCNTFGKNYLFLETFLLLRNYEAGVDVPYSASVLHVMSQQPIHNLTNYLSRFGFISRFIL